MAQKTLIGIVVSTKMKGSVVVVVTRKTPHPLYKKLLTVSKRYIVSSTGNEKVGDEVTLREIRKTGAKKFFKIEKGEK